MEFYRKLPIPQDVKAQFPISAAVEKKLEERKKQINSVFNGESDKFLLVIGPCSADNEDSVMDYIHRLRTVQDKVADKVLIVPRI